MKRKLLGLISLIIIARIAGIPAWEKKIVQSPHTSGESPLETPKLPSKLTIKEKAEKVTVFISRGVLGVIGSGVIIGQSGQTLYVLTASHVVGIPPEEVNKGDGTFEPEDPYEVTTNDGEIFKVGYHDYEKTVKRLSNNIDLAVLELKSSSKKNYENMVAKLTTSMSKNMPVYIFGYLHCSLSAEGDKAKPNQFSYGKIFQVLSKPKSDDSDKLGGYDLYYNNNTVAGMSGSPVFDADARVVAIHAKTNSEEQKYYDSEVCNSLPSEPKSDYGDNLGISIKSLVTFLPQDLQSILDIDSSPVKGDEPVPDSSLNSSRTNSSEKNSPPFVSPQ